MLSEGYTKVKLCYAKRMKLMGIDYGSKNVGIALSDDDGKMAFPKDTLLNTSSLVEDILKIIHNERVATVVIGESKDLNGEENPIMKRIHAFKENLEAHGIVVAYEDERFSSREALRLPQRTHEGSEVLSKNDAAAATIILQAYIDTHPSTPSTRSGQGSSG